MLDGDNAGMLASEKMLEKIKANEMTGYRLILPDNYDPDIFILEFGLDVFNQIADQLMQNESKILKIKL
jgi:DNA primase